MQSRRSTTELHPLPAFLACCYSSCHNSQKCLCPTIHVTTVTSALTVALAEHLAENTTKMWLWEVGFIPKIDSQFCGKPSNGASWCLIVDDLSILW